MSVETTTSNACLCLMPDDGEVLRIFDEVFCVKVTGNDTGGNYAILTGSVAPGGGPPLHAHPSSETLYILSGEFLLTQRTDDGITIFRAGPG